MKVIPLLFSSIVNSRKFLTYLIPAYRVFWRINNKVTFVGVSRQLGQSRFIPPTATALPRNRGSEATSHPTKNASASKCTAARCSVRFTPPI